MQEVEVALIEDAEEWIAYWESKKPMPLFDGHSGLVQISDSERWDESGIVRRVVEQSHTTRWNQGASATDSGIATRQQPSTTQLHPSQMGVLSQAAAPRAQTAAQLPSLPAQQTPQPPAPAAQQPGRSSVVPAIPRARGVQRAILAAIRNAAAVEQHNQLDWIHDLPSAPTTPVPPKPPRNK